MKNTIAAIVIAQAALVWAAPAQAISIELIRLPGAAPATLQGGGTLDSVMADAASYWENIFQDEGYSYQVAYGWAPLDDTTLATASQLIGPRPGSGGWIDFDNDGSTLWFADDDVTTVTEYQTLNLVTDNLGGGDINVGRYYTGATGNAAGAIDLFSVAIHEIGHLLGITSGNPAWTAPSGGEVVITAPLPGAGTVVPVTGGHINVPVALMDPVSQPGRRDLASDLDIIAIAEMEGYTNIDFSAAFPTPVPVPTSLALAFGGLAAFGAMRLRGRRAAAA